MAIQNGKRPLSQKAQQKSAALNMDDIFGNPIAVEPEMAKAIESNGYTYRWVNATKLASAGGYHHRGWKALPTSELKKWGYGKMDSFSFTFGQDPDGFVRRGDLVLAVRPKEKTDIHRAYLKQEADRASNVQKKQADELKQMFKDAGVDGKVHEGYEDDRKE
jgi:hypothetical protein